MSQAKSAKKRISFTGKYKLNETPYSILRKTRKERIKEITNFSFNIGELCTFHFSSHTYPLQVLLDAMPKHKLSKRAHSDILAIPTINEVITPTMSICINEFQAFISELQVGAYNGAARTLRCILETAVEACEFQTETKRKTGKTLMSEYVELLSDKTKKKQLSLFMFKNNVWVAFLERSQTYEKHNRIAPSFKEIVNLLNSRQLFSEAPQIHEELKDIYELLSDYIHPNSTKFEKVIAGSHSLNLRFSTTEFDQILALGKRTLDVVLFLYIQTIARFSEFQKGHEFLVYLAKHTSIERGAATSAYLSLPFSSKLTQGIKWKTES